MDRKALEAQTDKRLMDYLRSCEAKGKAGFTGLFGFGSLYNALKRAEKAGTVRFDKRLDGYVEVK